jgi:hypothetical protein
VYRSFLFFLFPNNLLLLIFVSHTVTIVAQEAVNQKTTLCVSPVFDGSTLRRTSKLLRACAAGIQIVAPAWLHMCIDRKEAVIPAPSIIAHTMLTKTNLQDGGLARMAAIVANGYPRPLDGYFVLISRTNDDVQLLADLAEASGAEVARRTTSFLIRSAIQERPSGSVVLVGTPPCVLSEAVLQELKVVGGLWLFDVVSSGRCP